MHKLSFHEEIVRNKRKSLLLTFFVFIILVSIIYFIGYILNPAMSSFFFIFALFFTFIYVYSSWKYGDKIILAATNAKPAEGSKYLQLNNIVEELSIAAGIPKPKVYIIESEEMNAFATGRDPQNSSIAITTGLLKKLNRDELSGVIGHEISHICNYDIRFSMIVAVMVGLVAILSDMFLRSFRFSKDDDKKSGILILIGLILAIIAPIVVRLVQLAISRKREYLADSSSAKLTRYPEGLASALEKIKNNNRGDMKVSEAISHLFFADPKRSNLDNLFATHPPIEERIKRLRSM